MGPGNGRPNDSYDTQAALPFVEVGVQWRAGDRYVTVRVA